MSSPARETDGRRTEVDDDVVVKKRSVSAQNVRSSSKESGNKSEETSAIGAVHAKIGIAPNEGK